MVQNIGEGEFPPSLEKLNADLKSILEKIEIDEEGVIFFEGMRYVFVPQRWLMITFMEILKVMGASIKNFLWPFISISGATVANQLIDRGAPPENVIEAYAEFNNPRGWGLTKSVKTDLEKPEVIIQMYNDLFSSWLRDNVKNLKNQFPFFESAWGANWIGAVQKAIERKGSQIPKLTCKQVKFLALGDDYDEWIVKGEE
ncbi:MAG: hypothetical protein ACUVXA_10910 [Candidatus Jordarchaeum sp.]|uniref:hypothetical protein n=1 Tax=Candidatus Jordarchaeum sp. TaxID=2823881 RepID=UPI0040494E4B